MQPLPHGMICEIARAGGLQFKERADRSPIRCPLHDDRHASAVLIASTNCFHCSVCTPDGGWSAKRFAEALKIDWGTFGRDQRPRDLASRPAPKPPVAAFGPEDAAAVWNAAFTRARDDDHAGEDLFAYDYLRERGVLESWELGALGLIVPRMSLHTSVSDWPGRGYWVVAPLYDASGAIANIQGRSVNGTTPKTLFPAGSKASGTLFAGRRGLDVLRGGDPGAPVLLAEGLTDYLALSIASPIPVLSAPGTGMCASGIGPWARDRVVYLGLDCDEAGGNAVSPTAQAAFQNGARRLRRIRWPTGCKDACDVIAKFGLVALGEFLANHTSEVPHG
jgi:hypothetical protein